MLHHINDILVEAGFLPESYHIGICDEILPLDRLNRGLSNNLKNTKYRRTVFEQEPDYLAYSQIPELQICLHIFINNPMLYHEVEESVSICKSMMHLAVSICWKPLFLMSKITVILQRRRRSCFSIVIQCAIAFAKQNSYWDCRILLRQKRWH